MEKHRRLPETHRSTEDKPPRWSPQQPEQLGHRIWPSSLLSSLAYSVLADGSLKTKKKEEQKLVLALQDEVQIKNTWIWNSAELKLKHKATFLLFSFECNSSYIHRNLQYSSKQTGCLLETLKVLCQQCAYRPQHVSSTRTVTKPKRGDWNRKRKRSSALFYI